MNDLPEALDQLAHRVEDLERRVHALEHPEVTMEQAAAAAGRHAVEHESAMERATGVFPVLGRAMLGIAGAYLLRAPMDSTSLPKLPIAGLALAYALAWLVGATRTARFAGAVYAGTSALILAPMLWELTLRFNVLSSSATATVLAGFVLAATALAWKRNLTQILWVAYCAGACTALALCFATRAFMPFITVLLLLVLVCEYCELHARAPGVRPLMAAAADIAVWALIFIYNGPQSAHDDYPALSNLALLTPASALFAIHGSGVVIRSVVLLHRITVFETLQAILAFLLAAASVLYFAPQGSAVLGVACLVLAAAAYAAAFARFWRVEERRNFRVFASWSAALLLSAMFLMLPREWAAILLAIAALVAVAFGARLTSVALDLQGLVYLIASAVAAGLPAYVLDALGGSLPGRPTWSLFIVTACAVVSYAVARERIGERWPQQLLHLVTALLATCGMASLVVVGLVRVIAFIVTPEPFHLAFLRTLTVCSLAAAMAFGGALWGRLEMTRIAYAALIFTAVKLVFEDLREGRMEFIAVSIFLFAVTLIAVPRLARMGRKDLERTKQP